MSIKKAAHECSSRYAPAASFKKHDSQHVTWQPLGSLLKVKLLVH